MRKTTVEGSFKEERLQAEMKSEARRQGLKIGDIVEHKLWGRGTVKTMDGPPDRVMIWVSFQDEERKLMARYAPIVKL